MRCGRPSSANEHETHGRHDAAECGEVTPGHRLAEHHDHEDPEYHERDRLLRDLELRRRPAALVAETVGGDGERVLDTGQKPADEYHPAERAGFRNRRAAFEVPVPG